MRLDPEVELEGSRFSWSVTSLPEGKTWGLRSVHLCAKYRLLSKKIKVPSHKVKGLLYSYLLITHLPSGSRTFNCKPSIE